MLPGVGVFGTGSTARVLVPLLRGEGFVVQAVWGRTEEEARTLSQELEIPFYTSHTDDVLLHPDVDLVCINIPPPLTRQIAVKALGIGKNVICEKAATSADAFKMVTASRYYPQLMSLTGSVLRFLPAFARMKRLLEEGYAGEVQTCDARVYWGSLLSDTYGWSCDELMGGGGLHTMGSYIVDLLSHLTGRRASRVHGLLRTFVRQNGAIRGIRRVTSDDFCFFQMLMGGAGGGGGGTGGGEGGAGGVCCTVTLNFNMPGAFVHEVMVVGSAGRLVARGTDLYGQRNGACQEELLLADPSGQEGPERGLQDIPPPYLKGMACMVRALHASFLGQEDRRSWDLKPVATAATFEDGLYVQTVVDAIKKSSRSGEWERVEVMTEEPDANHNLCEALQRNNP
ncbi:glucose-fructose oxidoreductase domain-containing protein 2 [Anguilla anguilla]|uniref:glucose-fructose oxidoreductase domain-containing protein 2 n=1 Tax=Anguilla anguilla TaxID=7936 RepID=UPI0015B2E183|nr:glucose-fructose oxidoreductase domain-containing protein 2 [Anguilla anguilla]XP_035274321.1 glucose-fructose oxidoreductase domain-containing protein 2 [Anguilla anguilla]XP_035274322.1 glucose-fructose oxidoreductase domain-containing protein 2 [Anguilla anguilla]XP_035274323.1 glucose-fructose oxidoreductase domain-containing protein 2 [Anguilla anguilla]XP_035274324.1 glucose-fructose oxidoreductase domain-containing protein 2 [Anguilla anguilla]